jgi:hypothetical protein
MLKRLSTVVLSAGLLLGLTPVGASALPVRGSTTSYAHHGGYDDDHYRCMYRCGDRYEYRYRRYRPRYCWYHDRYGWYRARCRGYHNDHYYGDGPYWRDRGEGDSAHAGGGYDSHREHDR